MELTFDYTQNISFGASPKAAAPAVRRATPKQLEMYASLCAEKHIVPVDTSAWTVDQAHDEIQRILDMHLLTADQRALINAKIDHLRELGCTAEFPQEAIDKLTSGRDGTASKFIQQLFDLEQRYMVNAPVNEEQLKTLVSWYYCPDIAFEDYDVPLTMPVDIDGQTYRRRLNVEEFAREIQAHFNYQSAREFIQRYRADFHDWRKTRITIGQINRVRELEARMAEIDNPRIVDLAVDLNGEPVILYQPARDRAEFWNPRAYVPIGDAELLMYSQEEATRLIAQLESESHDPSLRNFGEVPAFEDRIEEHRNQGADQAIQAEVKKLNDIVFSLMATLGEREDDLEHEEVRLIVERWEQRHDDFQVQALIDRVVDLMVFAVDGDFISQERLMDMIGESTIALAIYEVDW